MQIRQVLFILISVLILAVLIIHISQYIFLCDDAFISFRYAKNFASGMGLVFNSGERVEGYTNFLWTMILSIISFLGPAPDQMANILSVFFSLGLLGVYFYFNRKFFSKGSNDFFILLGPLFLATNRTYAVWSTGGLETALFSILLFTAIMMLVEARQNNRRLYWSALLFSLAALTRPEGILLFASFFGYYLLTIIKDKSQIIILIKAAGIFVILVGSHFIFRLIYYGYPFPNTFYAKVTGDWFDVGFIYLWLFIHEYGLYFIIIMAALIFGRRKMRKGRGYFSLMLIPFLPYVLYLAYIGGDHFEFRPLMPLIPFLALVVQETIRALYDLIAGYKKTIAGLVITGTAAILLFFWTVPSLLSHLNFPDKYDSAIAVQSAKPGTLMAKIPVLNLYLKAFDSLHAVVALQFSGIRQEEHKMALEQVFEPQAMMMKKMVENKYIQPDEIISLWCVGAIPYYSGLTTIDFLGLTDEHVAHRATLCLADMVRRSNRLMAHEKRADWNYLAQRKVQFISTHPSRFFFPQEQFLTNGQLDASKIPEKAFLAPVGEGQMFVWRSTFPPEYFRTTFNNRGLDFYLKSPQGTIIYSPASQH